MRFESVPRAGTSRVLEILAPALSLLAGLAAVGLVFLLKGLNPLFALGEIFRSSFGSVFGLTETVTKALPLILVGSGLALTFQAKFWNIGAESQLLLGAVFSTWVGLTWGPSLPGPVIVPLMFLAGFLGGALWGMIPAALKIRLGINEVISTLMLNYIAAELVKFLVVGPWKGASKHGYPYTDDLPAQAILWLFPGTRISPILLVLAPAAAATLTFLIFRTRFGYEVRVIGENREAARYAGIDFFRTSLLFMAVSGGLAGLAGTGELTAIHHHLSYPDTLSAGYGFTAIIVAWLGRLNPLLVMVSGVFLAGIIVGGDAIQMSLGLPAVTVQVFNGIILIFLIMGEFFLRNRIRWVRRTPRHG